MNFRILNIYRIFSYICNLLFKKIKNVEIWTMSVNKESSNYE